MCGIVGYVGQRDAASVLMDGLSRLEYSLRPPQGGHHKGELVYFQRTGKNRGIFGVSEKIQIDDMLVIAPGKLQNGKRLAALTAPFDNQGQTIR